MLAPRIAGICLSVAFAAAAAAPASANVPMTTERPEGHGTYIVIDESSGSVIQDHAGSHIIFANRCKPTCTITPGGDDSRTNRSSIISSTVNISEYAYGDDSWNAMMDCLRDLYSPFDVLVTDEDPGDVPHFEAIVAGTAQEGGQFPGVLGVSPFSCGVIENAITYTFSNSVGNNPQVICEIVGQESAHAFGLDHEYLCEDPMTYLTGCGKKTFQDIDASCGTNGPTNCSCGGATQNSFQRILALFGDAVPPTPPDCELTSPTQGDVVRPGFRVNVEASDNVGVERVEVSINGDRLGVKTAPPYEFRTDDLALVGDTATIEAKCTDDRGAQTTDTITIFLGEPCSTPVDCNNGETCIDGRCVPFEVEGGLGDDCEIDADCLSGICVEELGTCTEICDPTGANGCPFGFECATVSGGGGACLRGETSGCGCVVGGRSTNSPAALGLFVLALLWFRRRRTS